MRHPKPNGSPAGAKAESSPTDIRRDPASAPSHAPPHAPPQAPPHAPPHGQPDDAADGSTADATGADITTPDTAAENTAELPPASELQQQLLLLQEQRDKYLRLAAEYDNFRKRAVRERLEAEHKGMGLLIRGILDALDDIGRFAHVDPASTDAATLVQGVDMVEKKLLKSLAGHGLEIVNPMGQPFDPAVHEALTTMPASRAEDDHTVGQVYQVGYVFNGQLLRAARVVVLQWSGGSGASDSSHA